MLQIFAALAVVVVVLMLLLLLLLFVVLLFSALVSVLFSLLLVCSSFRDLFALSAYPTAIFFCFFAFVSLLFFVFVFVLTAVDVSAGRLLHCTVDPCKWDLLPGLVA